MSDPAAGAAPARPLHIHVFAIGALGPGVSGGDKFFLEFTRHWRAAGHRVTHYVTEEGRDMIAHYGLASDDVVVVPCRGWLRFGIEFHYLVKSLLATSLAWRVRPASDRPSVFFSASDSLPDVWPALLARLVHHDVQQG